MVSIDRLHALRDRVRDLKGYLNIEAKLLEIAEEEKQTQDPDFWNDPKKAEQVLRTLRSKKKTLLRQLVAMVRMLDFPVN